MEHYQTLGVDRNASPDDIKKAYRRLAGQHHPDKGGDTATFQKIQSAYETLSDPQKKQEYDNPNPFGHGHPGHPGGGFHGGFPPGFQFHMNGFDMNDVFGQMFGHPRQPQRPTYKTTIWVTLEQVYSGGEQSLQFNTNGENSIVKIQIPKGVENGANLRYDGLIKDGTLIVEFRVHNHPRFQRNNADLITEHPISVLDLIVGTSFKFTTISGKVLDVMVKPRTQPGAMLRISGEGLPLQHGFGDQMILLKSHIPDIISDAIINSINESKNKGH
jgi:DnaJ-class molecular chaperone